MITKYDAHWVGGGYGLPVRFATKLEIPRQNPGVKILRLAFRFEVAYVLDERGQIQFPAGWLHCVDMHTKQGRLIGPKDLTVADNTPYAETWRGAFHDRTKESLAV